MGGLPAGWEPRAEMVVNGPNSGPLRAMVAVMHGAWGYVVLRGDEVVGGRRNWKWNANQAAYEARVVIASMTARPSTDDGQPTDEEVEKLKAECLQRIAEKGGAHAVAEELAHFGSRVGQERPHTVNPDVIPMTDEMIEDMAAIPPVDLTDGQIDRMAADAAREDFRRGTSSIAGPIPTRADGAPSLAVSGSDAESRFAALTPTHAEGQP